MDLIDFAEEYRSSPEFNHLRNDHTNYVSGRGSERPVVMLLSDAPTATENNERKSVAGQPGRVLDQLMGLAGLYAEDQVDELTLSTVKANAYITNMVKYRVGMGGLTAPMIRGALDWVRKEWKALHCPPVIIPLGSAATACVIGKFVKLREVVAQPFPTMAEGPIFWPMIHPNLPLARPDLRPESEAHWQALGAWLKEEGLV